MCTVSYCPQYSPDLHEYMRACCLGRAAQRQCGWGGGGVLLRIAASIALPIRLVPPVDTLIPNKPGCEIDLIDVGKLG